MTKAEREALEALADKWATDRNWGGDCVEELRTLLATLDKPATRYPWADAPEWAMWAATDEDGAPHWYAEKPVCEDLDGFWNDLGSDIQKIATQPTPDWRNSLERRPDAP